MRYAKMKELLEYYVDDIVDTPIAVQLLNAGKDKLASAVNSVFPDLPENPTGNEEFVFDGRFHELPVIYAAAMVKSYDSSIREKESYLAQFQDGIREFVENYDPPVQYLESDYVKHFTVTDEAGQTDFVVTARNYNSYGNIDVYVNSQPVAFKRSGPNVSLLDPAPLDSVVTLMWEPDIYDADSWMKAW